MLEGQGADEVFAGYFDKLIIPYSIELIKKRKIKKFIKLIYDFSFLEILKIILNFLNIKFQKIKFIYRKLQTNQIFNNKLKSFSARTLNTEKNLFFGFLDYQLNNGLLNLLHYGDSLSMANSIESRLPLLT